MAAEWKNLTDGSFKGFTFHVAVPQKDKGHGIANKQIVHERKLQVVERPLTDGSEPNDFGRKGKVLSAQIIFHGSNYQKDFKSFLDLCNEGSPGVLTLPDEPESVAASFQRMTERAEVGGANSKSIDVTWVESGQVKAVFKDDLLKGLTKLDVKTSADKTKSFAQSAIDAVNSNPVLAAIRSAETGLSKVRSVVNAVTSLTEGVRNRIAGIDAEIRGTLAQIKDAVDEISTLFGAGSTKSSIFSATINPVTGQKTADFSEPDQVTPAPDPLVSTRNAPTTAIQLGAILSPDAATNTIATLSGHLQSTRDDLTGTTSGRTDEVHKALTAVVGSLGDLKASIVVASTIQVVVPAEMSLMEILFANGHSVDELDDAYRKNRHITDPLVVPAGTVITL